MNVISCLVSLCLLMTIVLCQENRRVTSSFVATRGKKSNSIADLINGSGGESDQAAAAAAAVDNCYEGENCFTVPNDGYVRQLEKRNKMGFQGMRGKKAAGSMGFTAVRGKKFYYPLYSRKSAATSNNDNNDDGNIDSNKDEFYYLAEALSSSNGAKELGNKRKFYGMRGKKFPYIANVVDVRGKKGPSASAFLGTRGKKWDGGTVYDDNKYDGKMIPSAAVMSLLNRAAAIDAADNDRGYYYYFKQMGETDNNSDLDNSSYDDQMARE